MTCYLTDYINKNAEDLNGTCEHQKNYLNCT